MAARVSEPKSMPARVVQFGAAGRFIVTRNGVDSIVIETWDLGKVNAFGVFSNDELTAIIKALQGIQ